MSSRPIWEQVLAWCAKSVFIAIFVAPVVFAALFFNDFDSGSGRLGLLLPAIILADAQNRQALMTALAVSFAAVFTAWLIGTGLGLASAQSGNRVYKAVRSLALLPGRIPAWVLPACFAVGRSSLGLRPIPESIVIYVWFAWVSWWGATRIGEILANAVRSVSRSEWDTARTLAGGSLPLMKVALLPRVAADYRKEAKKIAAVCLFDPTPVFFLGLANWPMGNVSRLLTASDLRSLVDASAWILWLFVIWSVVAFAFRLASGSHGRGKLIVREDAIPLEVTDSPVARSRAWLLPCIWPIFLASVLLVAAFARLMPQASEGRFAEIAESHWDWIASFAWGSGAALTVAIFLAILSRYTDAERVVRFLKELTSFWPLEAAICSAGVLVILADRFLTGRSSFILVRLVDEIWSPVFFFFVATGIRGLSFRRTYQDSASNGSADAIASAAADAARTLGIPKRHADLLAKRTWRRSQTKIPVGSVLLSAWWLWNSPSWALVPNWRISSVPTGGQILVSRISGSEGQAAGLVGVVIVLGVAAMLATVKWARTAKIRHTQSAL